MTDQHKIAYNYEVEDNQYMFFVIIKVLEVKTLKQVASIVFRPTLCVEVDFGLNLQCLITVTRSAFYHLNNISR